MDYENLNYQTAYRLLEARYPTGSAKVSDKGGKLPPKAEIEARRAFDEDDHWQNTRGFIGQLPTGDGAADRTELLRRGFSPEPIITEVLDTHVENVLGNEPQISLEDESMTEAELAETLAVLKDWYDRRKNTLVLSDALRGARRECARVIRAFIPSGNINGEGRIAATDLKSALDKIWFRSEPIEQGGVVVDEDTAKELGLFLYKMRVDKQDVSLCEYSYLDESGKTMWGTLTAHNANVGAEDAEPFELGGHLPIYQLNTKALITSSVCQAQRCVNLSGTMLTRNNNLAGSRERLAVGVQPPGEWVETGTDENNNPVREFQPAEMRTGPATFNFLSAEAVRDSAGQITAFANPNVIFTDPVPIDSFVGTSDHWRRIIYSRAKMRHLLMADDATASGKSRIEARKEFQASLNESKEAIDPAGSWMLETALRIAAEFMSQPGRFAKTKARFEAEVSTLELTPEETKEIRANYEAGLFDERTALEMLQVKNVDEVLERLEERRANQAQKVNPPGNRII